jgi:hypothetical protein
MKFGKIIQKGLLRTIFSKSTTVDKKMIRIFEGRSDYFKVYRTSAW